eukprot:403343393
MSERKEQRLNQFLECLNNIAEDQILQDLQEEKKNPNTSKQMSLGVKRNVISGIFQDIPQVINAIMEYLDENGFNVYGSKVQQASQDSLKNQRRIIEVNQHVLKAIIIIFKDYEQPLDQDIIIVLYKTISEFVKSKGYHQLIQMITQNQLSETSKSLVMRFVRKSLQRYDRASEIEQVTEANKSKKAIDIRSIFQTITNEIAEYFINPDYLFHDKAFDDQQLSPNSSMLEFPMAENLNSQRHRQSQGSFLRKGYDEDDINQMLQSRLSDANRNSTLTAYPPSKNMLEGLLLQQEFSANRASAISQRSSKLDSLTEHDKISLQLREDLFQETFIECMKNSNDADLPNIIEMLGLLINYSLYNERDFERHGGYSVLQMRLQKCQEVSSQDKRKANQSLESLKNLDQIFDQLFMVICPLKSRIKTYNALKLLLNLVEQCENHTIQIQALTTLKMILEKELENCVIFHKANGYKYFESAITQIAIIHKNSKLPILRQILEIASHIIFVLGDLDILPMIEFISGLIQYDKQNITNEIYEEITNFQNSIISDKIYRLIHKKKKYSQHLIMENQNSINILGQGFVNGFSLLQQSIENLKTKDRSMMTYHDHFFFDQSIKLLIKICDYQIKVYSQSLKSQHSLVATRDTDSKTVLDKLLENSENLDKFISKLLNCGLTDNLKYLKILNLTSQLLIIQQPLFQNSDVTILKILDYINTSAHSQFYQVFLAMLFGREKNPYVKKLAESIELNNGLISKLQDQLIAYLPCDNQSEKLVKDLHFLTLLTRYSRQNQETYDKNLDIFVFLKSLNLYQYMQDQQTLILQFLLELQGQNPLYERAIDSPEIYIEANINQILSNQYVEFNSEMKEELRALNVKFNNNIQEMIKRDAREELQNQQVIRKSGLLRGPNESLTMFLMTLIQSKPKVQISIFQDLICLMNNQSENRKIITDMEALEFMLKIFDITIQNQKTSEIQAYAKALSDFIYQLLLNVRLSDPDILLRSLKDKNGQINSYHLQNVIQALQIEQPLQHIQIQQDENQSLEDNIELFSETEFTDQIVFNGWFQLTDLKPNQNLLFQVRSEKTYMKFIYERNTPTSIQGEQFVSDTNDNLIILLNDYYKRIPIDVSSVASNSLSIFKVHEFNNFHIQITQQSGEGFMQQIDCTLIMINGIDLTDQLKSKMKFESGPFKVLFPYQSIKMTKVKVFDRLLNESEVSQIYNNGLLEDLDESLNLKPIQELPSINNKPAPSYQKVTKIYLTQAVANKGWSLRLVLPINYDNLDVFLVEDKESPMSFLDYQPIQNSLLFQKLPLKQYLCNANALIAALNLIDESNDEKQLFQSLTFLASIIIRNNNKVIEIFQGIDGFETLRELILKQQSEKLNIEVALQTLIDICCNQHNINILLQKQPLSQSNILRIQPRFDTKRMDFMKIALRLIPQVSNQHMSMIVSSIQQLIQKFPSNMSVFRETIGIQTILRLFQLISSDTKFIHFYDQILQVYELYITAIKNNIFEDSTKDLRVIFDFLTQQSYKNQKISTIAMDCLSIIAIHIVVDEQGTSLIEKVLQLDIFNSLMTLMRCENPDVKEYSVKFMSLLLYKSSQFRVDFKSRQGFKFMNECLNHHNSSTSRNLIKTIIEASTDSFDNANALYPSTSSIVHTLMNDSEIAHLIVDQLNKNLHKPKKSIILHFEMFQSIFTAITLLESEQTSANMLKEIRTLIKENVQNDINGNNNIMNLHREYFSNFLDYLFDFLHLKEYRLEQVNQSLLFSETQTATDDSSGGGSAGTLSIQQQNNNEMQKINSRRSIELALELLTFVVIYDLQQLSDQSQTLKYVESWIGQDVFKQLLILSRLLKYFEVNPKIQNKEYHTLANIKKLVDELDNLLEENVYVNVKFMQLINSFAFKNTMDVRKSMKQLQLFEIRDDLMISIIRYCGDNFINNCQSMQSSSVSSPMGSQKPSPNKAMLELIQTATHHKKSYGLTPLEQLLKLVSSFSFETYEENLMYVKSQLPELVTLVQFKEYGEGQMKGFLKIVTQRLQVDANIREQQKNKMQQDQLSTFVNQARQNLRDNKITQVISGALNYGIVIV